MEIKEIRQAHGMSQIQFFKATGIPRRTIENWESGERKPPPWLPKMIEAYLNRPE